MDPIKRRQRPCPPRVARWSTCQFCGKRTWISRREAKAALKRAYPGQFKEMQVYPCKLGGTGFHHGHRIPKRFRESSLSSCKHCKLPIERGDFEWVHTRSQLAECFPEREERAIPFWSP